VVAHRPWHRSQRGDFPHWALQLPISTSAFQ